MVSMNGGSQGLRRLVREQAERSRWRLIVTRNMLVNSALFPRVSKLVNFATRVKLMVLRIADCCSIAKDSGGRSVCGYHICK
jgi:hypothetical protein